MKKKVIYLYTLYYIWYTTLVILLDLVYNPYSTIRSGIQPLLYYYIWYTTLDILLDLVYNPYILYYQIWYTTLIILLDLFYTPYNTIRSGRQLFFKQLFIFEFYLFYKNIGTENKDIKQQSNIISLLLLLCLAFASLCLTTFRPLWQNFESNGIFQHH